MPAGPRHCCVALLTVVVCIATPRAAPPPETPVVERVEVSAVSVPVQVTLDGEPLRGLSTANFELFDRGKKQSLSALDVIDLELLKRPPDHGWAPQLPVAGRRHFLIVFDLSFTRPASIQRARRDMRQWVSNSLDPTDLVAVATYSVNRGPKLILNFSSDRDQIAKAITRLGELDVVDQHTDPLAFAVGALQDGGADMDFDTALEYGFSNAEENTLLDVLLRDVYQGASQRLFDQQRRQPIHRMSQTFGELAQLMRALQGRKYLIYLSEGFDSSLIFSDHRPERVLRANRALESGEMWRVDSTRRFGSGPTQSSIFAMLEEFRRADCVIQAVDVGEFRNSAGSRSLPAFTESLQLMANETGGELYRDFDDVGQALDEMLRMTSLTYVLWFTPRKISADGEFHRLKVKLKGVPKKAEVSHRPGYFAPAPRSARSAEQDRLALGQRIMAGQAGGSISTSILAAPFRKEPHRAFVPVLIEIDGPSLSGGQLEGRLITEIYAYALDAQGGVADFFTQILQLDLARVGSFLAQRGLKFYGEMELPSGEYSLRVLIHERMAGVTGMSVQRLDVPTYSVAEPILLAPLFPEARGLWVMAREARLENDPEPSRFPFLSGVDPWLPAAAPRLHPGRDYSLYVPVYNLPDGQATISAGVTTHDGRTVREVDLPPARRSSGGPDGAEMLATVFSTAELGRGRYRLVLTIVDPAGRRLETRSVPFDIVDS